MAQIAQPGSVASRRRWPWWVALLTATVLPVATARRTGHARTWQAAIVHALGMVMLAAVGVVLAVWSISADLTDPAAWQQRLVELRAELPELLADRFFWAVAVGSVLVIEAGLCVAAWGLMAWQARDELVPRAFVASLRRLWLLTPHAVAVLLLGGLVTVPLERVHQQTVADWLRTTPVEWSEDVADSPEQEAALEADWQRYRAEQPWLAQHATGLATGVRWLIGAWALVVALRAGAARRWGARCRWPPVCGGCGHSLLGRLDREACSECGLSVASSVGPGARPGAPALGDHLADLPRQWWRCTWGAVAAPMRLGDTLRAMHPERGHRVLLAVNALLAGAVGFAGAAAVAWIAGLLDAAHLARAALLGLVLAMGVIALALVLASLVGSMATRTTLSPLLPAAMQGACHLTGLIVVLIALNMAIAVVLAALAQRASSEPLLTGAAGTLVPMGLMVLNVTGLALYLVLLWRIVMAARFANW